MDVDGEGDERGKAATQLMIKVLAKTNDVNAPRQRTQEKAQVWTQE